VAKEEALTTQYEAKALANRAYKAAKGYKDMYEAGKESGADILIMAQIEQRFHEEYDLYKGYKLMVEEVACSKQN
jgi:hypothetical protein